MLNSRALNNSAMNAAQKEEEAAAAAAEAPDYFSDIFLLRSGAISDVGVWDNSSFWVDAAYTWLLKSGFFDADADWSDPHHWRDMPGFQRRAQDRLGVRDTWSPSLAVETVLKMAAQGSVAYATAVSMILRIVGSVSPRTFYLQQEELSDVVGVSTASRSVVSVEIATTAHAAEQLVTLRGFDFLDRVSADSSARTFRIIDQHLHLEAHIGTVLRSVESAQALLEGKAAGAVSVVSTALLWLRSRAEDGVFSRRQRVAALNLLLSAALWAQSGEAEDVWEALQSSDTLRVSWALQWLDEVAIELIPAGTLIVFSESLDRMAVSSDALARLTRFADVEEHVDGLMIFKLGQELLQGWAVNLEGALPVSEYQNWEFNSFACIGGRYFAANDRGLYALGAERDEGEAINARVLTMMTDFGTPAQKRVVSAYMGYTASGELVFKVRSVDDGVLTEHWYAARDTQAGTPRENMVRLGRGMKSRYWQFELENVDGSDFEIDQLELHPVRLRRRV